MDEKFSGNSKVTRKYPVTQFTYEQENPYDSDYDLHLDIAFQINFKRSLLESNDISAWKNKNMTGFHAEWHLEYRNGTILTVSQPPTFTWGRNKLFREFMSMLNSIISSGRMTAESVMEKLKDIKKDWILGNREKIDEKCTYYDASSSTQENRKTWIHVFDTKTGLGLKSEEVIQILSEYSYEMGNMDTATEIREGLFKRISVKTQRNSTELNSTQSNSKATSLRLDTVVT